MSEMFREELLTFKQAAAELPGRPHISTLHRWRLRGTKGIRLTTCVVGGRRYTSREAIRQFVAAVTARSNGQPLTAAPPSNRVDEDRVARELDRAGL
jgi:hypothetical protein